MVIDLRREARTIPPFIVWAIGSHVFKINPAVLMGGVAGRGRIPARAVRPQSKSGAPCPGSDSRLGYAVSGILLTIFGNFAMLLAQ
ncbi:hypothetical protein AC629_20140 [Bradyrhizobium sp. NAS80.1]|uniref:hypothetical protein n=1 Tax=Bradyrhizobium sp. NAS80.1 TaxID=1680159 RepID=UPI00095B19B8|nr:hypothetical protein [Bradyrhizobium sp. NAS80.1]OKO85022.1 hypothetical protein AC629_20140 [Bradyrhizobium sp. NAS80.1]